MSNETAMVPVRGGGETVTVNTGTPNAASSAAPPSARMVRISDVSADVYVALGSENGLVADTDDLFLSADMAAEYFPVQPGMKVAVERISADATIRIHWMRRP